MCLILFAHQTHLQYPLVVAANRDEFFSRPTRQAHWWEQNSQFQVLAGRDLELGGTWMGVSRSGRFAAVTNIRDPSQTSPKPKSRGLLCTDYLFSSLPPADYLETLLISTQDFAGFNLLLGDGQNLYYFNNAGAAGEGNNLQKLSAGVYGLSNGLLDTPWPKVVNGKQSLQQLMVKPDLDTDSLISLMRNRHPALDGELPDTGVPVELERALSSAFITNPERQYGTRCSTALLMGADKQIRFSEQNYDSSGQAGQRHFYQFTGKQ